MDKYHTPWGKLRACSECPRPRCAGLVLTHSATGPPSSTPDALYHSANDLFFLTCSRSPWLFSLASECIFFLSFLPLQMIPGASEHQPVKPGMLASFQSAPRTEWLVSSSRPSPPLRAPAPSVWQLVSQHSVLLSFSCSAVSGDLLTAAELPSRDNSPSAVGALLFPSLSGVSTHRVLCEWGVAVSGMGNNERGPHWTQTPNTCGDLRSCCSWIIALCF